MGEIVSYRSPRAHERTTALIGMVIFIAAWAMMFACLFFAYGGLRIGAREWPPIGQPRLPIALPALNTLILALSSLAIEGGLGAIRKGRSRALGPALLASLALGAAFLVLQYVTGSDLYEEGLTPRAGPYASVFYGLAGIHALHVAVGLLALSWLSIRAFRGAYTTPQHIPVRLWAVYWHFVGFVWLLMFVFVFVL